MMQRLYAILLKGICMSLLLSQVGMLDQLHAQINTYPYYQGFETSNGGWSSSTIDSTGNGPNSWVWGSPPNPATVISTSVAVIFPGASNSSKCWMTGNNGFVLPPNLPHGYFPGEQSAVVSPAFDFTNLINPHVKFQIWWETEFNKDGVVFQASTDSGATWQKVGGYLDPDAWFNANQVVSLPGGDTIAWSGHSGNSTSLGQWTETQHKLDGLAGAPNVMFRFAFASDNSTSATSIYDGIAFDEFEIVDLPALDLSPTGGDTICFADTAYLDACIQGAVAWKWKLQGNFNPNDTLCSYVAVSTGNYVVEVEHSSGFNMRDTFDLFVSPTYVYLGQDTLLCPGDTLELNMGNASASHSWIPSSSTSQFLEVTEAGTYTGIATDGFGCVEEDSIKVFFDFVPDVDLGNDTTFCAGESIILDAGTANPGTTYDWNPINAQTQTVFVSQPGIYDVLVTTPAGCEVWDTIQVTVELDPVVDLGPNRIECDSFILNALNPGSSYLWSTNDTTQSISSSTPGMYWVEVTNPAGCSSVDTVVISLASAPVVDLGPDDIICNGNPVTLNAGNPGATFLWNDGSFNQTLTTDLPGQYIVAVTNASNCVTNDTIMLTESGLYVNLGADIDVCEGTTVTLNAGNNGTNYMWNTNDTTNTIDVSLAGTYWVDVFDAQGCVISDSIQVNTFQNFTSDFDYPLIPAPVLYAPISFTNTTPGSPTTYYWEFGDGNTSTLQNPTHTYQSLGTFTVCLTVSNAVCSNTYCEEIFVDIFQDIEDELTHNLEVYPNPNNGQFHLAMDLKQLSEVSYELYDLSGKAISMRNLGTQFSVNEEIELGQANAGVYLLKISIDGQGIYRKVMVR
ncbi:PKD domain-containing protein [Pontibacter sp. G13]|uniref:PKD domain-containing protein n=1 Tax=Pontibacter sp. G13 TaxID=3074898 RepID=UPI00288C1BBA|nr:PKD domain-containing protein [Pontibacter sp. G13]WNJ18937.1 PKD domain-containing protein [Pontibacter sp. G13]